MTDLLAAVRAASDDEWAELCRLLLGYFPTSGDRPEQRPEDEADWLIYAYVAGRGAGKTRTGAEWVVDRAMTENGTRWAIVGPTFADVRDTCIEGESGVLKVLRRRLPGVDWGRAWNRTLLEIALPNGSRLKGFSADEPERLRGPQHHGAWCDEVGSWRYDDTWDQLQFGLRLGDRPRTVITTTPRPTKLIRKLRARADDGTGTVHDGTGTVRWVSGSTFDNAANLSAAALAELKSAYEGTRIGRQELYAELLTDTPGALWTLANIEANRVELAPVLRRVVVAIDPAVTAGEDSDSTGIVAAGLGVDGDVYVLQDRTCRLSPEQWARAAVALYDEVAGDRIVAEVNNGGDLVEVVLRAVDPSIPVRKVHASRGKRVRHEPVAALYEQGRVHHVGGFAELEEQMTTWTPDVADSPDRLDALVWAVTELVLGKRGGPRIVGGGVA